MKYRKKPVEIYAIQFFKDKWDSMATPQFHEAVEECYFDETGKVRWTPGDPAEINVYGCHKSHAIKTLEGWHKVSEGDFVIKGIKGEFYPCKPDIFEASYDKIE